MKTTIYPVTALLILTLIVCAGCENPWMKKIVDPLIKDKEQEEDFVIFSEYPYFLCIIGPAGITIDKYTGTDTNVTIPSVINGVPVTAIGNDAFKDKGLTSVTIPYGVTSIGNNAFEDNQLTYVSIPGSVTSIGNFAFSYNQLTSVTIPSSITVINWGTFMYNQLASVTIPNSVISIENNAFAYNSLSSVTIPGSVTAIGGNQVFSNNQLTSITFEGVGLTLGSTFTNNVGDLQSVYIINGTGTYTRPDINSTNWTKL
ncbi:MAG: leucine-rich repeat domain-containing protein [Treponema sp.]|nr:leucine-rich repeat domain-containing protein [Treponema sp.]